MAAKQLTAKSLQKLSGVPAPTISRFLTGAHAEPRSKTVQSWARALNVTEAQLRGIEPIEGISVKNPCELPLTLESVLTRDEMEAIEGMRNLDQGMRQAWLMIGKELCRNSEAVMPMPPERRTIERRSKTGSTGAKYRNPNKKPHGGLLAG